MNRYILPALLLAIPALSQAPATPAKSVPQRIADDFIALAGGVHPGYRIAHAKGIVVTGTFTPSPGATSLSRAPHLAAASTPVIARYSNASGVPTVADNDPNAGIHGLAIRFQLPNNAFTDIVANSRNGFAVGTGEDFAAFLDAVVATKPDSKHPSPIEAFLGTHPAALRFATTPARVPVSYGTETFYGNDAFIFVNAQNVKKPGRYRLVPVAGAKYLDSAAAAKVPANYLSEELTRRLAKEPVKIRVLVQLPNPGDPTSDASVVWPDDRKLVEIGVVTLTTVAPDNAETQRKLAFNPIYLTDGIQLSDDPLPAVRSAVYALSVQHRANVPVSKPSAAKE
jgi:catalase